MPKNDAIALLGTLTAGACLGRREYRGLMRIVLLVWIVYAGAPSALVQMS